tara:strand:- start:74 stop:316 length:243 start_codon:yes stop_codon:yes gene_type:complete
MERFGIVSHEVISDPKLSLIAKAVYSVYCIHANKSRTCFPSNGTVADMLNVGYSTVSRGIKELKDARYIKREGKFIKLLK